MAQGKTPGVYIEEKNAFPNSVVEVPTAVPAFIGYTEKAERGETDLTNIPTRISSLTEYELYFGGPPTPEFSLAKNKKMDTDADTVMVIDEGETKLDTQVTKNQFRLYHSMRLFFANGGGPCWVTSVGRYTDADDPSAAALTVPLKALALEQEPTMIVVPDAVGAGRDGWKTVSEQVLAHCGEQKNRIALLDVYQGYREQGKEPKQGEKADRNQDVAFDTITEFREKIGANFLSFGAAYYPWINTSVVDLSDLDLRNINADHRKRIAAEEYIGRDWEQSAISIVKNVTKLEELNESKFVRAQNDEFTIQKLTPWVESLTGDKWDLGTSDEDKGKFIDKAVSALKNEDVYSLLNPLVNLPTKAQDLTRAHQALYGAVERYRRVMDNIRHALNLLPPGAGMAGVLTRVDNNQGVFKAPANTGMASVISPAVNISDEDQRDLNVPINGKALNAIRAFPGRGVLVWGARTLDGNSQDWRYINVRRTLIMLEQSIKYAALAYVFAPNTSSTWVSVGSMIGNFLNNKWKEGALAGTTPAEAYSVDVGLGSTMTGNDILDGYMRVVVKVAVVRPAEFIVITFQQQMQTS